MEGRKGKGTVRSSLDFWPDCNSLITFATQEGVWSFDSSTKKKTCMWGWSWRGVLKYRDNIESVYKQLLLQSYESPTSPQQLSLLLRWHRGLSGVSFGTNVIPWTRLCSSCSVFILCRCESVKKVEQEKHRNQESINDTTANKLLLLCITASFSPFKLLSHVLFINQKFIMKLLE